MQSISEEFQHGRRVARLLQPILSALHEGRADRLIRIVDIGCGTGFVVRLLAANESLEGDVKLIGADFNVALVLLLMLSLERVLGRLRSYGMTS